MRECYIKFGANGACTEDGKNCACEPEVRIFEDMELVIHKISEKSRSFPLSYHTPEGREKYIELCVKKLREKPSENL